MKLEIGHTKMYMLFTPGSKYVPDPSGARAALENALVEGAKRAVFYGGLQGDVVFTLGDRDNPLGLTFENGRLDPGQPTQPIYGVTGFDDYEYDLTQYVRCSALRLLRTRYSSGMPWPDVEKGVGCCKSELGVARLFLLEKGLVKTLQGRSPTHYCITDDGVTWLAQHEESLTSQSDLWLIGTSAKTEYILPAGSEFKAKNLVLRVMQLAQVRLGVVDSYLDDKVFPYLDAIDPKVEVRLLTANRKPMFIVLLEALKKSRSGTDARECSGCHDRFLVLDDNAVWHLGTSINHLGSKLSRLSRVTDEDERKHLLSLFDEWWSKGTPVLP